MGSCILYVRPCAKLYTGRSVGGSLVSYEPQFPMWWCLGPGLGMSVTPLDVATFNSGSGRYSCTE